MADFANIYREEERQEMIEYMTDSMVKIDGIFRQLLPEIEKEVS